MNTKELQNFLHVNFEYKEGALYYKNKISHKSKIGEKAGHLLNGYLITQIQKTTYRVHQLIFLYHHGYIPKIIDHIDRNPLNNNIENLREVTKSENGFNRGKNKNNTSKYKCVTYMKDKKKWKAYIKINGKQKHLGYFMAPELAYEAYCKFVRANLPIHYLGE